MAIQVTWLSHAGFALQIGTHRILIDPFLSGNPGTAKPADLDADFILLSHGHGDHIGDAPHRQAHRATVVANNEIGGWLRARHRLSTHGINPGGGVAAIRRVESPSPTIAHRCRTALTAGSPTAS